MADECYTAWQYHAVLFSDTDFLPDMSEDILNNDTLHDGIIWRVKQRRRSDST